MHQHRAGASRRRWRRAAEFALAGLISAGSSLSGSAQSFSVMVPMRDGVRLATDIYLPGGGGPWPAIVVRTPYDKSQDSIVVAPSWIAEVNGRGYAYIVQDTRGRFASEGIDSTFWTDGWGANQDGYDTIEWVGARAWCDGNVGTYGESARGIVQYLAAGAAPPSLRACIIRIACEDFYQKAFFQGGELRKCLVEGWFERQHAEYMLPFFYAHPTRDPFWDQLDLATRVQFVNVPILHIGGYYDIFGESAIDAYTLIQEAGGPGAAGVQKLLIGPWTHYGINEREQGELVYPPSAVCDLTTLEWRWFDRWLKGEPNGIDGEPPISYYLMGDVGDTTAPGNEWMTAESFPEVQETPLFLHGPESPTPRTLQPFRPATFDDALWYETDPADPLPTHGGRNLYLPAGPYDQAPIHEGRTDGFELETPVLEAPLRVVGKVKFRFWAECSATDTDWCAKLIDVYPDGRKMLVTDGILKARFRDGFETEELLTPWTTYEYEVDLWSTAIVFATGHRIMLSLTNANTTRFEVNPQSGAPFGEPSELVVATVGVSTDAFHPSHLLLPVVTDPVIATPLAAFAPAAFCLPAFANPADRFEFEVFGAAGGPVLAEVFDAGGRRTWASATASGAGSLRRFRWEGLDGVGRPAPAGVYFLRLRDRLGATASTRLVLIR